MWTIRDDLREYGPTQSSRVSLPEAREYCRLVTKRNAENFTVASWLLPKEIRPHFHAVYAYCRWSDDLADETGDQASSLLKWWRAELDRCFDGQSIHPVMIALRETIGEFAIPKQPFGDLLTAFEQDQNKTRYESFDELLGYCQYSANPVGRIILYLFRCHDDERGRLSDEICTGLQLANFWQDVSRDHVIGRCYLPLAEMSRFDYTIDDWQRKTVSTAFLNMMKFQVERTQDYFHRGKALLALVPKPLRVDLALFIRGGEAVLNAIRGQNYDVWSHRPKITKWRKLILLKNALLGM